MISFYKDLYNCKKISEDNYELINIENGTRYRLNELGLQIIKSIDRDSSKNIVVNTLKKNHTYINEDYIYDYINQLIDAGIVISNTSLENKETFTVQWHITDNCNLRCKHCYMEEYSKDEVLSFQNAKYIIDKIINFTRNLNLNLEVSITGGEPLMHKDMFKIIEYIRYKDCNSKIYILTNGTLINNDIAYKFRNLGINRVQVSIDGSNEIKHDQIRGIGSFDKAIKGIHALKTNNIYTMMHSVLMKNNKDDVVDIIKLSDNLKIDRLTFSRYIPQGTSLNNSINILEPIELKDTLENIIKEGEKYPSLNINNQRELWSLLDPSYGCTCSVIGERAITLLPDGTVLPCRRFPIKIGNINNESLYEIFFRNKLYKRIESNNIEDCLDCDIKDKCMGGCYGLAFNYFGKYGINPDPQCWKVNKTLPSEGLVKNTYIENGGYYILDQSEFEENVLNI